MHNISNQLYKYVAELIIEFFISEKIQKGERFNLYLEDKNAIELLFKALSENSIVPVKQFNYLHPDGGSTYSTIYIEIATTKVLISSSDTASEDYLTMLRNRVAEQEKDFEDTAILIIFSGKLDSLLGGSGSLIKEGMPLHHSMFKDRILKDIDRSPLLNQEKKLLKEVLERKTNSVIEDNHSIFDFKQVINTLYRESIDSASFNDLGLFPHEELKTKEGDISEDVQGNFELFEKIENIFLNGEPKHDLEKEFPPNAVTKLLKDDWKSVDYAQLVKWLNKKDEIQAPVFQEVEGSSILHKVWYKTDGDSVVKSRNLNIIIFNSNQEFPFELIVKYDQPIKKNDVVIKVGLTTDIEFSTKGGNLILSFTNESSDIFKAIEYFDSKSQKKYIIKILHLPFDENFLSDFEGNFNLVVSKKESYLQVSENSVLTFNNGGISVLNKDLDPNLNEPYVIDKSEQLDLNYDYALTQDDLVRFKVQVDDTILPIAIKTDFERPKPITGVDVWKEKRVHSSSFKYLIDNEKNIVKLLFKNEERTVSGEFRTNLAIEYKLIHSEGYSWFLHNENVITDNDIELNTPIKEAFDKLKNYYKQRNLQPSLVYFDSELTAIALDYVNSFIEALGDLEENKPLSAKQKNLLWLGVVQENFGEKKLRFSPLHPLNIAYQLQLNATLDSEDVSHAILKRLSVFNLVPYIENKSSEIYIPVESNHSPEWLYYTVYYNTKQTISKDYVGRLVLDKMRNFIKNFNFLFYQSSKSPIKINVVNLGDCREIVRGIFLFYKHELDKNLNKKLSDLIPVEVYIYGSENIVTKFEELTFYEKVSTLESNLNIDLSTRNFEKEDLLNTFLDNVKFYSKTEPKLNETYEYGHLCFYQFDIVKTDRSYDSMDKVKTGISLKGLVTDLVSTAREENYRTGFGMLDLPNESNDLIQLSCLYNAFARVATNDDPYDSSKALCTTVNYDVKKQLEKIYDSSQWVTYVDPKVDLDFFKDNKDVVIIHSSDQYTNSSGYDAITVSKKTSQYENIVKDFLETSEVEFDQSDAITNIIDFFNAINGEWLFKLLRQDNYTAKEKLSLLSGIKFTLTVLYHPDIIWVPISLEEILRVSGNAGLSQIEGVFSTKNLGKKGSFSDDLLLVGLEKRNNQLMMHLYPVELKIGGSGMANKAKEQGINTSTLLNECLTAEGFVSTFYKNFFAKLVLTSANKMSIFNVWSNGKWDVIATEYRKDLLDNNFDITTSLNENIGSYGLVYFRRENTNRTIAINNDHMYVDLRESDGYFFLSKSIDDLIDIFHNGETTIDKNCLLANLYKNEDSIKEAIVSQNQNENIVDVQLEISDDNFDKENNSHVSEGIKIEFGTDLNTFKSVVWEPNNTDKVMHTNTGIIGTMGTGKTQFTKSLISQLYSESFKNIGDENLGVLIFDYKGDYIKDDFVSKTNAKVFEPYHLPYNPLVLDAKENSKPMLPLHTANDLKETISNAFNLGNVQRQKLRDLIVEAYEDKGIYKANRTTWNNTPPTLADVCDIYLSSEQNAQDSLYAAISNLSDFEIFEPDANKTKSLYSLIEGVVVINLSGYDESIQNLIVAITLDAFYTQMQSQGHSEIEGSKRQIKKMILVDEADNFLSKNFNSIRKILKEGREFGVGTILSTQFLNHFSTSENDYSNYILTWVIHRVNEIKMKEVESLFSLEDKGQKEALIKTIKDLDKHQSVVNLAGSRPILIKDKAFWELL
ncbi:DNA phosphorothioation-dependent restriction protein DptH [Myroides odoratimimus]|uniref:DNA phosphorothioation-dependent restriction protein DptH n=1 Tax=Myroides odoratimimus TaxID=76832 RepID=UPI002575A9D0|nr:DNA phosphorothioation-dependent restriction protein DptH [Myroides odoratimimus]MDM1465251.1 DNA phosphorothioation-dependent restriction protein DptH [Myroides odoratimimus]MDM1475255.1 DNA phosphorothioation-dependent restriction protein DptH [Myroides odoratimimus]